MTDILVVVGELGSSVCTSTDSSSCSKYCDFSMSSLILIDNIFVVDFDRRHRRNSMNVVEDGRLQRVSVLQSAGRAKD